jgi:hypothetical protein
MGDKFESIDQLRIFASDTGVLHRMRELVPLVYRRKQGSLSLVDRFRRMSSFLATTLLTEGSPSIIPWPNRVSTRMYHASSAT